MRRYWYDMEFPELRTRVQMYPEQVNYANRLYRNALENLESLYVEQQTERDIGKAIEHLRAKLREYRMALSICLTYCRGLKDGMDTDIDSLYYQLEDDSSKECSDDEKMRESLHLSLTVLVQQRGTLKMIHDSCAAHLNVIQESDRVLKIAQRESNIRRANSILLELKSMDECQPGKDKQ